MNEENQVEADTIRERIKKGEHKNGKAYRTGKRIGPFLIAVSILVIVLAVVWLTFFGA